MAIVFIGIDDTDNETSPGTGKLSRRLAVELGRRGVGTEGITRHQFLLDERIPYTTHNSGACLAVQWNKSAEELHFVGHLIGEWAASGSDPGVCVAASGAVTRELVEWGWAATREVLTMDAANVCAAAANVFLRALGGSGQGIIGAMASVGLRADGNEGRFLDLPGLRDLAEVVEQKALTSLGIRIDHRTAGPAGEAPYRTNRWVRPRLVAGKAVWPVEWSDNERAWVGVDQKRSRPLE